MIVREIDTQTLEARGTCCRLFSAAYCLPDEEYITSEDLREIAVVFADIGSAAEMSVKDMALALEEVSPEQLKLEYSRLFVGPFRLPTPPYGSVYLDDGRRLMGDSTLDVVKRYREVGIGIDPIQHDMPDHIAVELEFVAYLLHLQQLALQEEDGAAFEEMRKRQESFLEKHLCEWGPRFAKDVASETKLAYFRSLAEATNVFLTEELERVRSGQGKADA